MGGRGASAANTTTGTISNQFGPTSAAVEAALAALLSPTASVNASTKLRGKPVTEELQKVAERRKRVGDPVAQADALEASASSYGYLNERETSFIGGRSAAELMALNHYTFHGDRVINGELRGIDYKFKGTDESKGYIKEMPTLKKAVEASVADRTMVVFRGIGHQELYGKVSSGDVKGAIYSDKGYSSTSASYARAKDFASGKASPVVGRFIVPKGFQGAAPIRPVSKYENEQEILIRSNTKWVAVGGKIRSDGTREVTFVLHKDTPLKVP
jgi:hypothetical protein